MFCALSGTAGEVVCAGWWQGWKVVGPRWIAEFVALLSEECVAVVIVAVACAERDPQWCAAVR